MSDTKDSDSVQPFQCSDCGNEVTPDEDGYAVCWGTPTGGMHGKRTLARPCEFCGTPQNLEICADCAEETPGSAVTPTWGKHRYQDTDS